MIKITIDDKTYEMKPPKVVVWRKLTEIRTKIKAQVDELKTIFEKMEPLADNESKLTEFLIEQEKVATLLTEFQADKFNMKIELVKMAFENINVEDATVEEIARVYSDIETLIYGSMEKKLAEIPNVEAPAS